MFVPKIRATRTAIETAAILNPPSLRGLAEDERKLLWSLGDVANWNQIRALHLSRTERPNANERWISTRRDAKLVSVTPNDEYEKYSYANASYQTVSPKVVCDDSEDDAYKLSRSGCRQLW